MSAVTVAVRCRPLSQKELQENSNVVVSMEGQSTTIVDPLGKIKPLSFTFDHSFWSTDPSTSDFMSQEKVFAAIGTTLLDNTFQGYNGCIFAYGQTGSGKTYSMLGYGEEKGIIPRLCCELFERAAAKKAETDGRWQCQAEVSYLEIYNEKCRCLLSPNAKQEYRVREHPVTGPYVENLTRMVVHSFEEIENIMDEGNKTRTVAATNMNATSSRSHAIFTIVFKQITTHESLANAKSEMCSRLNLVDLAGSERADKTGATGKTLKEGSNINQSLTTLGKVINGLAEGVGKDGQFKKHVPFRDSALTWLLKENLCGNSKTIMLAALSPSGSNYEETVSTLRYANQAKMLRTQAVVNEDPSSKKIRELTEEIERLKSLLESNASAVSSRTSVVGSETELPASGSQSPRASSADDAGPSYEQMCVEDRMALAKRLLAQESQSWEERETNTSELQQLRAKLLSQQQQYRGGGANSKKDLPRLFNLNEDPSMSGCLMYVLPVGKTTVGSDASGGAGNGEQILLEGEGILPQHAVIIVLVTVQDGDASGGPTRYETLVSPTGTVRVNGSVIAKETTLRHGDRLILGEYHVFSFSDSKAGRAEAADGTTATSGSGTDAMDYNKAMQEKFEQERAAFARQQEEMLRQLEEEKRRNERLLREQEEQLLQRAAAEPVPLNASFVSKRELHDQETAMKLRDLEEKVKAMEAHEKQSLAHRYLSHTSVIDASRPQVSGVKAYRDPNSRGGDAGEHHSPTLKFQSSLIQAATIAGNKVARLPNQQIFRQKVVLLGHQEVGKTSLRKCFESDPIFFKKLPDVKATTGIETQMKTMKVESENVDLCISDFAGQEAYHSHTLFLTGRSIFVLVWKISAIEQDFHSSGISDHELHRLMMWVNECYSKFPKCGVVLAATHLDELRDQSQKGVEFILNKVEKAITRHMEAIARTDADTGAKVIPPIVANVAVTCKNRQFVAAGEKHRSQSGGKISSLLQIIANASYKQCFDDDVFRCGAVPGRHIRLMQEILDMKNQQPQKLLLPLSEFVHMAVRFGVENDAELLQITQLMHSWNCVYMFNQHKIHENLFIFLHPTWLCRLAGVLFSFAHVLRTPVAHRSMIGGLEYTITAAEQADMHMMKKGFLRLPLARVLFRQPLAAFLKKEPEEADFNMALQLLASLSLIQSVDVPCDDQNVLLEETTATSPLRSRGGARPFNLEADSSITRWFVPSLSPFLVPADLRKLAPVLFQRGVHVKFDFNMLPDEMWWRFQFQLQEHQMVVSVRTPRPQADDADLDEDLDADEYRLPEADEDHNRWKDAMWLHNEHSRVLLLREDRKSISLFSADADPKGSQALLEVIETTVLELLDEYKGIQRLVFVACPIPTCNGWHDVRHVAAVGGEPNSITCAACKNTYTLDSVVASGIGEFGSKRFPASTVQHAQGLLQWALDPRVCEVVCNFLGIEPPGIKKQQTFSADGAERSGDTREEDALSPVDLSHYDFLVGLDKMVRALMLRGMWKRSAPPIEDSEI